MELLEIVVTSLSLFLLLLVTFGALLVFLSIYIANKF